MSACIVKRVSIVGPHVVPDQPERNREDLNILFTQDGTQFVSQKVDLTVPRYSVGDLVIHIPHGSKLPPELQERLGAKESKIKAGNFSGVRSNGMIMPADEVRSGLVEGDDVTTELGVTY